MSVPRPQGFQLVPCVESERQPCGNELRTADASSGSRRADRLGGEESFGPSSGPPLLNGCC